MNHTTKDKFKKYKKLPKKVVEVMWNHGIEGWVYVPAIPGRSKNAEKKTSAILFEMFDFANQQYQYGEKHQFEFRKKLGTLKEIAEDMECSVSLVASTVKTARSKWDSFRKRERNRTAELQGLEMDVYFIAREKMMEWYMDVEMGDWDDIDKRALADVIDDRFSECEEDTLERVAVAASRSLIDLRELKERRK